MTKATKGDLVLVIHHTTHTSLFAGPQSRLLALVGEVTSVSREGIVKAYRVASGTVAKVGSADVVKVAKPEMFRYPVPKIVNGAADWSDSEEDAMAYLGQFRAAR